MSEEFGFNIVVSTRLISDFTGVRHSSVVRTMRRLVSQGLIHQPEAREWSTEKGHKKHDHLFTGEHGLRDASKLVNSMPPERVEKFVAGWNAY